MEEKIEETEIIEDNQILDLGVEMPDEEIIDNSQEIIESGEENAEVN